MLTHVDIFLELMPQLVARMDIGGHRAAKTWQVQELMVAKLLGR